VLALVHDPPRTVGELARVLGSQGADHFAAFPPPLDSIALPGVVAHFAWDVHHEHPVTTAAELERRHLTSYEARFPGRRADCERELRAAHGAPRAVARRRRYGPFFVDDADTDAFVLEWYECEPDCARPRVDPAVRERALAELAGRLERARTPDEAQAALDALGLDLEPRIGALELARALGRPDAVARSVDVHMSSYVLALPDGERTAPLRVGGHELEAYLLGHPAGERAAGIDVPAAAVYRLADGDAIATLRVRA
jgi:hypothetical protein